jgi:hypothetical protein
MNNFIYNGKVLSGINFVGQPSGMYQVILISNGKVLDYTECLPIVKPGMASTTTIPSCKKELISFLQGLGVISNTILGQAGIDNVTHLFNIYRINPILLPEETGMVDDNYCLN